jgi:brefeldin A-inhibited guanine nucleotide-exchange protein
VRQLIIFTNSQFLLFLASAEGIIDALDSLVNVITKLSSSTQSGIPGQKNAESIGVATPPPTKPQNATLAPSLSTSALSGPSIVDPTSPIQSEAQLRRQGLECLVAVLRSLVAWGTGKSATSEDHNNNITPDASASLDRLPLPEVTRGSTPDIVDDPSRFESAKQKKITLMEGIKRFNQKPKKVSGVMRWEIPRLISCKRAYNSLSRRASSLAKGPKTLRSSCSTRMG